MMIANAGSTVGGALIAIAFIVVIAVLAGAASKRNAAAGAARAKQLAALKASGVCAFCATELNRIGGQPAPACASCGRRQPWAPQIDAPQTVHVVTRRRGCCFPMLLLYVLGTVAFSAWLVSLW